MKEVVFSFGAVSPFESFTFKFVGFAAITYTVKIVPPAGPFQYVYGTANGEQTAMELESRMSTDIGAEYNIERQGNLIRITKKDNADFESASVNNYGSNTNYIADPSDRWDYNDLTIVLIEVFGNDVVVKASGTNRPIEFRKTLKGSVKLINTNPWLPADEENPTGTFAKVYNNLIPGNYIFDIRDGFNTLTQEVSVLQMQVEVNKTNVLCNGASTGAIVLTPTNGVEPYTYAWVDGPTTKDRSNLPAGNYQVTVQDANNDTKVVDIEITEPPALDVTGVVTGGSIDVNVSGGVGPYTYSWDDGPITTQYRQLLNGGDYTVTVTDANGCTAQETFTVTQANPQNTGYKAWTTLEQYRTDTGALVGVEKANDPADPDYVAPEYNPTDCPLP